MISSEMWLNFTIKSKVFIEKNPYSHFPTMPLYITLYRVIDHCILNFKVVSNYSIIQLFNSDKFSQEKNGLSDQIDEKVYLIPNIDTKYKMRKSFQKFIN